MANGKYAKYVNPIRLAPEHPENPTHRGTITHPCQRFDLKVFPEITHWFEIFHIYAPGGSSGVPTKEPQIVDGKEMPHEGGGHVHAEDEFFIYLGTNPHDTMDLGGEVEMWLGEGENAEKFIMNKPTAMFVPGGISHNPQYYGKVDRTIIQLVILLAPEWGAARHTGLPPMFSVDKFRQEQKGKGQYEKYILTLRMAEENANPSHRGKIADPSLRFDKKVYPGANRWIDFVHIYTPGAGMGVPTKEPATFEGQKLPTEGFGHAHNYDEMFLFLGTNPHATQDLGGEVEMWLGEGDDAEKFLFNKATGVFVPAGMVHNPLYFRKVDSPDKPIIMVVFADTPDYSVARITALPSAFSMA